MEAVLRTHMKMAVLTTAMILITATKQVIGKELS
jgi:hypothetical protein